MLCLMYFHIWNQFIVTRAAIKHSCCMEDFNHDMYINVHIPKLNQRNELHFQFSQSELPLPTFCHLIQSASHTKQSLIKYQICYCLIITDQRNTAS